MATIRDITYTELLTLVTAGARVIDIREDDERDTGGIDGHIHIPLSSFDDRRDEIPTDRTLIFYCQSGKRSLKACILLDSWGFEQDLCSLQGGLELLDQGS